MYIPVWYSLSDWIMTKCLLLGLNVLLEYLDQVKTCQNLSNFPKRFPILDILQKQAGTMSPSFLWDVSPIAHGDHQALPAPRL